MGKKNQKVLIEKDELIKLYWTDNLSTNEIAKIYGCTSTVIRKNMVQYNIPRRSDSESVKVRSAKRTDEQLKQRAINFRKTWYSRPDIEREIINKSRATKLENKESQIQKARESKLRNNTNKISKAEDSFYHLLTILFDKEDIIRPYTDERYPFLCDFYIKSRDLFIEYQGHPSHGYCPFKEDNKEHLAYLEKQTIDMTTWTKRDVVKLETAKRNNIRLALIYPHHNNYLVENNKITTFKINELEKI